MFNESPLYNTFKRENMRNVAYVNQYMCFNPAWHVNGICT